MRTRMNRRIVAEGKNATAVGRQIAEDVAEEFVETTRKTAIRPPKNATAVRQIAEDDETARETKEIQPPGGSSPNAQIYRSIVANKKSQSASNQSAFDAFLQKERRMREELNMTLPVEDRQPPPTREPRRVAPAEEILLDDFFRRDASPPTDGRDTPPEDRYLKPSFEGHGLSSPAPFDYLTARKNDMLQRGEELTVEDLNALLEHVDPYDKLEIAQKPDMSHGAIFRLEGALLDMTAYYFQAWQQTFAAMNLQEQSHREPTVEDASLAQTMTVEAAVKEVFYWTHDRFEIREIQRAFHPILRRLIRDAEEPPPLLDGAADYLRLLLEARVPCAVVSHLRPRQLQAVLHAARLSSSFPPETRVSFSPRDLESQQMLRAALRIERRPDCCVVHDTTPSSILAARDVEMKCVALMGHHARYELCAADVTVGGWDDLSVVNLRRMFADAPGEELELQVDVNGGRIDSSPWRGRRWAEGDR